MSVEIFIDLPRFSRILSDRVAQGVATNVRILAKQFVASPGRNEYSRGDLRDSIRTERTGFGEYQTLAGGDVGQRRGRVIAYALAQEFGRPDLPRYTFTPYMRPAAKKASGPDEIRKVVRNAVEAALKGAKVG